MKKLEATQTLPENYRQIAQLELSKNRGLAMILNLTGLGLLFGVGWLFLESLTFLRPAYVSSKNILIITGMREFWRGVLLLAVSVVLVIVLREILHGLVLVGCDQTTADAELPRLLYLHRRDGMVPAAFCLSLDQLDPAADHHRAGGGGRDFRAAQPGARRDAAGFDERCHLDRGYCHRHLADGQAAGYPDPRKW